MSKLIKDGRERSQRLQMRGKHPVRFGMTKQPDVLTQARIRVVAAVDDFEE